MTIITLYAHNKITYKNHVNNSDNWIQSDEEKHKYQ